MAGAIHCADHKPARVLAIDDWQEHWLKMRTTNPLERINREIRRRTRVVGAYPDGNTAVLLVVARLRHIAGTRWGSKMYMDVKRLQNRKESAA